MPELVTTLYEIKWQDPCPEGWRKLLANLGKRGPDDEPLTIAQILESNGIVDAIWALQALHEKYDMACLLFACFCARQVLDIFERKYPHDDRPRQAIETAERFAKGLESRPALDRAYKKAHAAQLKARAVYIEAQVISATQTGQDVSPATIKYPPYAVAWAAARVADVWYNSAAFEVVESRPYGPRATGDNEYPWPNIQAEFIWLINLMGEYGAVVK